MSATKIKILLVDDHAMFVSGLRMQAGRQEDMTIVGEANNGATALELFRQHQPDVVTMDVHLGTENGVQISRSIREINPQARIIILSADADISTVNDALHSGVVGYLLKENPVEILLQAIRAVAGGQCYLCPHVTTMVVRQYIKTEVEVDAETHAALSEREQQVLKHLSDGLRNKEIAEKLALSPKSVETYRLRMMHKLGCHSTPELIRYAIREGLIAL
jgi:DNA-binding NarL/FixJ family response regulator